MYVRIYVCMCVYTYTHIFDEVQKFVRGALESIVHGVYIYICMYKICMYSYPH
jgi:hypothetical protein